MILSSGSDTVDLRNPEYGDTEVYDDKVLVRRTRGDEVKTFRSDDWTTDRRFQYTITTITESVKDSFESFIQNHAGERISLTDHDDNQYDGYILNNIFDIITIRDDCSYDISFEFLVDSETTTQFYLVTENDENLLDENDEQLATERYS